MGGWMDYERMRRRNGLGFRKPLANVDPYPRGDQGGVREDRQILVGDLNRMERDYLRPVYPGPPMATRPSASDPAAVCARETGVDIETVRKVLEHVFWRGDARTARELGLDDD